MANEVPQFDLLEDNDFYKNFIFEEFKMEGVDDVTVSQLFTIDTQQLYDDNKENHSKTTKNETRPMQGILKFTI